MPIPAPAMALQPTVGNRADERPARGVVQMVRRGVGEAARRVRVGRQAHAGKIAAGRSMRAYYIILVVRRRDLSCEKVWDMDMFWH